MDSLKLTNTFLFIIVLFIIGVILKLAKEVFIALFLAMLLAYLMDPFVALFKKRLHLPLWLAVALTSVIFLGMFFGLGVIIYKSILQFSSRFPAYQNRLVVMLEKLFSNIEVVTNGNLKLNIFESLKSLPVASTALSITRSLFSAIVQFVMISFFAILIVYGKYRFIRKLFRVFSSKAEKKIPRILYRIDREIRKYIGVKTLICVVIGILTAVILSVYKLEFAVAFGFVGFILTYIPTVGPITAIAIPTLMSLSQFGFTVTPLWILSSLAFLHIFIGSLIEPKLMGDTMNLTFLVVFISLLFWGWMWGAPGVLLAVPMTTSVKIVFENFSFGFSFAKLIERERR